MRIMTLAMMLTVAAVSTRAEDLPPVAVEVSPDGSQATITVDLLAGTDAEGKRKQSWGKAVLQGISTQKWTILGTAAAAIAVDQLVLKEHDLLWYENDEPKSKAEKTDTKDTPPPPPPQPTSSTSQTSTAGGDTDQTSYNSGGGDIIINNY